MATSIYTYDEQKKTKAKVTEQDVYDGVMNWKKRWIGMKEEEVRSTIRDLGYA